MSKYLAPFHFDIVGSFLRPAELKEAREAFTKGTITRDELTAVEDRLITELIQKQKAAGLPVITDGEFRRAYWHLDFMWGFNGVKEIELEHGYKFHGQETAPGSLALTGKITGTNHPFVEHFKFVKQFEDENTTARQTIPAPSQFLKYLRLNNLALEGRPHDLAFTTHVCRGNYNSTWAASGGYEPVAPILFAKENVDAYYLEFDDNRSGGFEPLREVSPNKKVVLGLITSKRPELEDKEVIKERIKEATKYIPLERLCLSPQCGFASCEIGNQLTEEDQWAKLALVKEIAHEVWGD